MQIILQKIVQIFADIFATAIIIVKIYAIFYWFLCFFNAKLYVNYKTFS